MEEFTKDRIAAKVKKMKNGFRKAINSGRKSGGGRVVYALYDDCYAIWSGSPATEAVAEGIETTTINEISPREEATSADTSSSSLESANTVDLTTVKSDGA